MTGPRNDIALPSRLSANRVGHQTESLILASQSPRRAQLLRLHGYDFSVIVPPLEEPDRLGGRLSAARQAEALSYFKAKSVAAQVKRGTVLGADTVVALGDHLFGKPTDRDDARHILQGLSGTTHAVITGVSLVNAADGARLIQHAVTLVRMRAWNSEELDRYLDGGAWSGKAGAYGIQDSGDPFVECVEGSFTNVVGLPMELLVTMFEQWYSRGKRSAARSQ